MHAASSSIVYFVNTKADVQYPCHASAYTVHNQIDIFVIKLQYCVESLRTCKNAYACVPASSWIKMKLLLSRTFSRLLAVWHSLQQFAFSNLYTWCTDRFALYFANVELFQPIFQRYITTIVPAILERIVLYARGKVCMLRAGRSCIFVNTKADVQNTGHVSACTVNQIDIFVIKLQYCVESCKIADACQHHPGSKWSYCCREPYPYFQITRSLT